MIRMKDILNNIVQAFQCQNPIIEDQNSLFQQVKSYWQWFVHPSVTTQRKGWVG